MTFNANDPEFQKYIREQARLVGTIQVLLDIDLNALEKVARKTDSEVTRTQVAVGVGNVQDHARFTKHLVSLMQLFKADMAQLKVQALQDFPCASAKMLP